MVAMTHQGPTSSLPPDREPGQAFHGAPGVPRVGPGDRLGDFVLTRLLGVGGMGAVFEATQDAPKRTVAVKVLSGSANDAANAARRLRQEAELQGRLAHPGIAQVYDSGVADTPHGPVAYYAMEYIRGARSLNRYADENKLSLGERAALLARVCEAAEHGHRAGVVHRDLTPLNILVDADGRPRIIDFGIARSPGENAGTLATRVGTLVGTLRYMSPEQCEADPRAIDARSDVYSLGIVLYELACGGAPYELDNLTLPQAVDVIRRTPAKDAGAANPECRGDLAAVIRKALAKDKMARYQSAAELGEELERFASGKPVLAGRGGGLASLSTALTSFVRRRTMVAAALVVVGACVLSATIGVRVAFNWTIAARRVETWMINASPRAEALDRVRVIRYNSLDGAGLEALARRLDIQGVSGDNVRSYRLLHARLMNDLAVAGVSAAGWMTVFPGSDHTDVLVGGISALRAAGCEVWMASGSIRAQESPGSPVVAPELVGPARAGFAAHLSSTEPGTFLIPIAVDVGANEPVASMWLGLAGSARHPGLDVHVGFGPDESHVRLRATRPASGALNAAWLTREDLVRVFGISTIGVEVPGAGLVASDVAALVRVEGARARDAGADATRELADVLTADAQTRRRWYGGKVVLVGDTAAAEAMQPLDSGAPVWIGDVYAATTEQLLSSTQSILRSPGEAESWIVTAGAALLGVAAAWRRRLGVGVVLLAALTLMLALGSVWVLREADYLCNPLVPLISLWIAGGSWLVLRRRSGLVEGTRKAAL